MSTNHDHDLLLSRALDDLDAAPLAELSAEQQARADETLAHILGGTATAAPVNAKVTPLRRKRRVGRGLLLVAAALALTLVISMSGLIGGGQAYASWTPRPSVLPLAEQEKLADECRETLADSAHTADDIEGMDGPPMPTADDLRASRLVLADTRGDWTYVVVEGANGLEANCLTEDSAGFRPFGWFATTSMSSYGFMEVSPLAPDQIVSTGLMATSASEGSYWATEGHVGSTVAAVTVVTSAGERIEATVTGGRFAAWWPERLSLDTTGEEMSARYIVTLEDGTVLPEQNYNDLAPVFEE